MRVLVPPGQTRSAVTSYVALSRAEVRDLRDALGLVLAIGGAPCHIRVEWEGGETDVTLELELTENSQQSPAGGPRHR
ncbi:hypothetical protein GCM10009789_37540 [Kribbella sancticallisti]|uniref:Uncharacterized protein n=1 Tax=Kribbella sancticallisti TaxID=460087 RepID=A0ABN2DM48_9ACTN